MRSCEKRCFNLQHNEYRNTLRQTPLRRCINNVQTPARARNDVWRYRFRCATTDAVRTQSAFSLCSDIFTPNAPPRLSGTREANGNRNVDGRSDWNDASPKFARELHSGVKSRLEKSNVRRYVTLINRAGVYENQSLAAIYIARRRFDVKNESSTLRYVWICFYSINARFK